jgi:hypothetical protein
LPKLAQVLGTQTVEQLLFKQAFPAEQSPQEIVPPQPSLAVPQP